MPPLTQFEIDGGWSSLAHETAFWQQVAAETPATLTVAGQSTAGNTVHRIDLGTGTGQTMMISSLVHGDEIASREALMAWLRDLAYSTDPAVLNYLTHHRIVAVVPVNPDGFPDRRAVPGGLNINRDTYRLDQHETRVLMSVIADVRPHFHLDIHEWHGIEGHEDYWGRGGGNPITHPAIHALEQDCYDTVETAMLGAGYTAAPYPYWSTMRAGFSTVAGPMHTVGMLNETNMAHPPEHRVAIQRLGLDAARAWHEANAAACTAAVDASRAAARSHVGALPLYREEFLGREPEPLRVNVAGYQLTEPLPEFHREVFGVLVQDDGYVPMQQDAQWVIPTLLDPQSVDARAAAVPVPRQIVTSGKRPSLAKVNADGAGPRPVLATYLRTGGETIRVRLTD